MNKINPANLDRQWIIYTLKCPRTNTVRYVGWTLQRAEVWLHKHISEVTTHPPRTHKAKWFLSLVSIGILPVIEIIETGYGNGWGEAERRWIAFFKNQGVRLVNGTDGGEGSPNRGTPEYRTAIRKKQISTMTKTQRRMAAQLAAITRLSRMTPEQLSEKSLKSQATISPERRSEIAKKRWANKTGYERSKGAIKREITRTPESRAARDARSRATMAKRLAGLTAEQRRELLKPAQEARRKKAERWRALWA